jgi:hypothetical protein
MDSDSTEALHQAERIIWAAGWRLQEESVVGQLAGTRGVAFARLDPRSDVIQLVTYNGEHLGHVRREASPGPDVRWVAVAKGCAPRPGSHATPGAAAAALAEACGKTTEELG